MIKSNIIVIAMAPQALATVADIQLGGSTWTHAASDSTSQSLTSTCDSRTSGNWTDLTATGGYMEDWYCKRIKDVFNSELSPDGYWIITNKNGDPLGELLSSHDKCYYGVTRIESRGWNFKVGDQPVVNFSIQAIDQAGVSGHLHGEVGTVKSSAGDGDEDSALVVFEIHFHPLVSSSASNRYFGTGGGGVACVALGLLLWA